MAGGLRTDSHRTQGRRFFFFNDTATTEIYTLSLHDALPICQGGKLGVLSEEMLAVVASVIGGEGLHLPVRSEEQTSELQSPCKLVCRLLLEKKNPLAILDDQHLCLRSPAILTTAHALRETSV